MKKDLEIQGLSRDTAFVDAGRLIIEHRVTNLLRQEPGVRLGQDIEALHDMRVYSRRLREALKIFRPCFDKKKFRVLYKRARNITGALGEVRNLDVFIDYFEKFKKDEEDQRLLDAADNLIDWAGRQRQKRRKVMLADLVKLHTDTLYHDVIHMIADPRPVPPPPEPQEPEQATDATQPVPAEPAAPDCGTPLHVHANSLIIQRVQVVQDKWELVEQGEDNEIEALHALRIAFKKLRYAVEVLYAAFDRQKLDRLYVHVKKIQDCLGDMHDADVFHEPVCRRMKAAASKNRMQLAIGCSLIAVKLEKKREQCITDFHDAVKAYPITQMRADIEQALAAPVA